MHEMSSGINLDNIVDTVYTRLGGSIPHSEIRRSMVTIAGRWYSSVSIGEKWDIAREIGGNRYIATTYEILDAVFSTIIDEVQGD
jgi:hypothetical protein